MTADRNYDKNSGECVERSKLTGDIPSGRVRPDAFIHSNIVVTSTADRYHDTTSGCSS